MIFECVLVLACAPSTDQEYITKENDSNLPLLTEVPDSVAYITGQVIYVPVYSDIYHFDEKAKLNLSATLSIRNTDLAHTMYVSTIDYYDTKGELIRRYIEAPISLGPLETKNYVVEFRESRGGSGANFIVAWGSDRQMSDPIVEAVMISTASGLGISFLTEGKVIQTLEKPVAP